MRVARLGTAVAALVALEARGESALPPPAPVPHPAPASAVQAEVLANIAQQNVGLHTVADYHLPEAFLRSVADRIICASFEQNFRIVVDDREEPAPVKAIAQVEHETRAVENAIRVIDQTPGGEEDAQKEFRAWRGTLREAYPPLHGFKAAWRPGDAWPIDPPEATAPLAKVAAIIGKNLAHQGLLRTTALAIAELREEGILTPPNTSGAAALVALREAGMPVDLLQCFTTSMHPDACSLVQWMIAQLDAGQTVETMSAALEALPFRFRASYTGFRVATESGEHEPQLLRVQVTRGTYWDGPNDGGNVDLLRQLIHALPDADVLASIERPHVSDFVTLAKTWPLHRPHQLTVVIADTELAQWAQDNGKFGHIEHDGKLDPDGAGRPVLLIPRYPSRGEAGSIFVPGEAFLEQRFRDINMNIVHSPLLFQGGNLMAVRHPVSGERWLLLGEADVHRNRVLGLTPEQIRAAFCSEFGVDRCIVLPAVSYHIDYDVSIRARDGRLIALVNDTAAGAKLVLTAALAVLARQPWMDAGEIAAAREDIAADDWTSAVQILGGALFARSDGRGHFPLTLAEQFSVSAVDSGVGNLQRVLLALDVLAARLFEPEEWPPDASLHEYYHALRRIESAASALRQTWRDLDLDVVDVPGLPGAARAINAINGVHTASQYLMPAYGGLFAGVDRAAADIISRALGDLMVTPILSGESQRRVGAVRCSVSVHFRHP